MSEKIREAFDAWIASIDKQRDTNGWIPLTSRDVNMLREGYMEAALAQQPAPAVPDGWKLVPVDPTEEMLSAMTAYDGNYYTHPFDEDDFAKDYAALLAAAPAAPVAVQELPFWEPCNPACDPELNGFRSKHCDCPQAKAALGAPPAAEQPECVTCSGHGLVGNRLDDGEECPECHGAGIIFGTECGACAEQPDTVAVPRELAERLRLFCRRKSLGHGSQGDRLEKELRALLGKEGE